MGINKIKTMEVLTQEKVQSVETIDKPTLTDAELVCKIIQEFYKRPNKDEFTADEIFDFISEQNDVKLSKVAETLDLMENIVLISKCNYHKNNVFIKTVFMWSIKMNTKEPGSVYHLVPAPMY